MKLGELFYSIGADAKEALKKFREAEEAAKKTADKIQESMKLDNLGEGAKKSTGELKKELESVGDSSEKAGSETKSAFDSIAEGASNLASRIKSSAIEMGKAIIQEISSAVAPAVQAFNEIAAGASQLSQSIGNSMTSVGQSLTSKITKPALGVASALGGATLFAGFNRLTSLDNAQAKLRGIGYQGENLKNIMNSATESVSGTVYATADAADVASMALASGVKEGKDLDNYLNNVVNTASYMQAPLSEVAQIFNKVQAEGKLSGDVVSQLAARSISAIDILADRMGKTPDEIRKMVKEGEITFEEFSDAIGNYMGSAAAEMGGTFTGLMMNLGSRLAILGQKFLGFGDEGAGAFYIIKEELRKLVDFLPSLYEKAEELGQAFAPIVQGWVDAFHKLKDTFKSLDDDTKKRVTSMAASFAGLLVGIGPFLQVTGKMMTAGGKMGEMFTGLGRKVFEFGGAINGKYGTKALEGFAKALDGKKGREAIQAFGDALQGDHGIQAIKAFGGSLIQSLGTFGLAIAGFGALAAAVGGVAAVIGFLPEEFRNNLSQMLAAVEETLPLIGEKLSEFFTEKLPQAVSDGLATLAEVFTTMGSAFDIFGDVVSSLLEGLIAGFEQSEGQWATAAVSMVTSLGNALISNVGELLRLGALFVAQLGQGIADNASEIISYIPTLISEIASFIGSSEMSALMDAALAIVIAIGQGLVDNADAIKGAAVQLLQALGNFLKENAVSVFSLVAITIVGALAKHLITVGLAQLAKVAAGWIAKLAAATIGGIPALVVAAIALITAFVWSLLAGEGKLHDAATWLIEKFAAALEAGKELVANAWKSITSFFTGETASAEEATQAGHDTASKYAEGIESGKEEVDASATSLSESVKGALDLGESSHESGKNTADSFGAGIQESIPNITEIAQQMGISVEEATRMFNDPMYEAGIDLSGSLESGVYDGTPGLYEAGASASGDVQAGADSQKGAINTTGQNTMTEYRLGVLQQSMAMRTAGTTLTDRLADGMEKAVGAVQRAALSIMDEFRNSLMEQQESVASVGSQTTEMLAQEARSVSLHSAGVHIMAGLRNGLQAGFNSVRSFMYNAMSELQSIVTRMNAIRSPSRVYKGFGGFMMEGLGLGIKDEFQNVKATVISAMKTLHSVVDGSNLGNVDIAGARFEANAIHHLPFIEELKQLRDYQMDLQEETVDLLRELTEKDADIYMDGTLLTETLSPQLERYKDIQESRKNKRRGVRFV